MAMRDAFEHKDLVFRGDHRYEEERKQALEVAQLVKRSLQARVSGFVNPVLGRRQEILRAHWPDSIAVQNQ